jgi:hypothetical protein
MAEHFIDVGNRSTWSKMKFSDSERSLSEIIS